MSVGASMSSGARRPLNLAVGLAVGLGLLSSSCAYYNTFYLAKKYYATATAGLPYPVEKPTGAHTGNYQKSIDYAKKVIANYPKSKWVDDAYLLWAQALLGKEDPLQTINMLLDFPARYPGSPRKEDATFFLGVAYRQARKHREALVSLDEYLGKAPDRELSPYAHLERARALMSLDRPREAAQAASQVIERFPNSPLVVRARAARAEALLAGGDPAAARQDYQALGLRSLDDNERFSFLLREADCLEAGRDYAGGLALLTSALAHEPAPIKTAAGGAPTGPGTDRHGQLTLRIGTIHLLAGRSDQALESYRRVLEDYPKHPLGAEAQYRIGYTYETALDDFDAARLEYAKVRDHSVGSAFFAQATQRQQSLDRLAGYRSAGTDSMERRLEAGFLLAEQYLFQLDKPERALEAYAAISREHPGTAAAGKAMNAEAWVLRRRLERSAEADSLLWRVVREFPATEAQLAARDYLEAEGHSVPASLIRLPEGMAADTVVRRIRSPIAPAAPGGRQPPGSPGTGVAKDSASTTPRPPQPGLPAPVAVRDSVRADVTAPPLPPRAGSSIGDAPVARADTTLRAVADTTRRAPADTVSHAPADTTRRPPARWVPTDTLRFVPR